MKVLVSGSTGFLGSALVQYLLHCNHQVIRLVRDHVRVKEQEILWDSNGETIDLDGAEYIDAVVHLAAENLATKRWSSRQKTRLWDSRAKGKLTLSNALARLNSPPKVLASASAYGYYGDRGHELLTEKNNAGSGFIAKMT